MKLAAFALIFMTTMTTALAQVTITDSGSTNRPGMTITMGERGHAVISDRTGTKTKMELDSELHKKFMHDVEAAVPLDQMNASHCMKSASFGSSTYVTYKGVRSPDLSCPGQEDPLAAALQKDLEEIMSHVHQRMPSNRPR